MTRGLFLRSAGMAVLVLIAGCAGDSGDEAAESSPPPSVDPPVEQPWTVTPTSYGPVDLGVSLAAADSAAPGVLEAAADSAGCHYIGLAEGTEDVIFMVVEGRVVRVDVRDAAVRTTRGAAIGDSEARIRALYPELEVRPHKYTDGNYLIVPAPGAAAYRVVFETDGARVTKYRAGVLPQVEWVEGCS